MDVRICHALLFPATLKDIYLLRRGKFDIYFVYYAILLYIIYYIYCIYMYVYLYVYIYIYVQSVSKLPKNILIAYSGCKVE